MFILILHYLLGCCLIQLHYIASKNRFDFDSDFRGGKKLVESHLLAALK